MPLTGGPTVSLKWRMGRGPFTGGDCGVAGSVEPGLLPCQSALGR